MSSDRKFETTGSLSTNGEAIFLDHPKLYARLTKGLLGEKLTVTFQKYRAKRSDAQNRWMWGVCVPTVRAWHKETQGEDLTPEEAYSWLRISLLGDKPVIKNIMGFETIVMTGKAFSQMNTKEFSEAVNLIVDLMAERDCIINLPEKDNFIHQHVTDY